MDEMQPHMWEVFNDKYAVVMNKVTFRWEKEGANKPETTPKKNKATNGTLTKNFCNKLCLSCEYLSYIVHQNQNYSCVLIWGSKIELIN